MELDERMRRRFRDLAEEAEREREDAPLSSASVDRIVATTLAVAEQHRRSRRRRFGVAVAGVTALAAAAAVFVRAREAPTPPAIAATPPAARRCMQHAGLEPLTIEPDAPSRHTLSDRAVVDASAGTRARIEASTGCDTTVDLLVGSTTVWARDLGGGSLVVDVGDLHVRVLGTVFEVRAEPTGARFVAVREGRVEVRRRDQARVLGAGEALRIDESGTFVAAAVDALAADRLAAITGPDLPRAPALATTDAMASGPDAAAPVDEARPALDVNATLRAAETAYREGRIDEARRLFRQVGAMRGSSAEAALIRLGRLSLRSGNAAEAVSALSEHRRRFPNGALAAEARVAEAQALRASGRPAEAEALERWVLEHRPDSPQAEALRARRAP